MLRTVEIPLWLLLLIVAFAAVTLASHLLFPSVRWYLRRRLERAVARINQRLEHKIQPFKLLRRHDMILRLTYDPEVIAAAADFARETGLREDVAFQRAQAYAREIVPSFSATAYFGVAIRLARRVGRAFYRVRTGHIADMGQAENGRETTLVFVMNHRSNMDYVLVTYLAAERSALSYAVGEWARVWPLAPLIRAMGAYFIRRRSRNALYRRVLARYVQMATAGGIAQAVFPEGGLSLDGHIGEPKLGIISYMVAAFDAESGRDIVFVPVALNYDRVLEDRVLVAAAERGERKFGVPWRTVLRYVRRHLWLRLTGRFVRFGYAAVNFGTPVSLAEFRRAHPDQLTEALAEELMNRIRQIVPVLPVPLVSACLVRAGGAIPRDTLARSVLEAAEAIGRRGGHADLLLADPRSEADAAIDHLLMRRLVEETPEGIRPREGQQALLRYYANSIAHLLPDSHAEPAADKT